MEIETHPFEPWLPANARLLMLGTFPPAPHRWCMPWYYPNFQNDMWRIFGICFFGDKLHFVDEAHKTYRLEALKAFLKEKGVAIFDTALRIRRTKNNASDKDLDIVEPADLDGMLRRLPQCRAVLAAGQLATKVFTRPLRHQGQRPQDGRLCGVRLRRAHTASLPSAQQQPCLSYGCGEKGGILPSHV